MTRIQAITSLRWKVRQMEELSKQAAQVADEAGFFEFRDQLTQFEEEIGSCAEILREVVSKVS